MRLSKIVLAVAVLFISFLVSPVSAKAAAVPVSSTQLIEEASKLDGKTVSYKGEVIGDIMDRGNYAWINVSDGTNAIGIYIPAAEAKKIQYVGRYCVVGDTVSLTGTFHRACAEHGGDLDIHTDSITVTAKGYQTENKPSALLTAAAGIAFLLALAGIILVIRKMVGYNKVHPKKSETQR